MKASIVVIILLLLVHIGFTQTISIDLTNNWQFHKEGETKWFKASVPGTVHTDLLANKLIPDPFYSDNESKLQWIDRCNWEYKTIFNVPEKIFLKSIVEMVFDGLDTYAGVYLNNKLILQADNMFRGWTVNVKPYLKRSNNELKILFASAQNKVDSIAKARLPLVLPDNNRVYVRKAQFQFGWDWGPKFVGCGIWKKIKLEGRDKPTPGPAVTFYFNNILLVQKNDSTGTTFRFEKEGEPIYIKGANWIPADIFLPRIKKEDYRRMLQSAKDANMNMLRVWGGGVYEDDAFYDLCDSMGIMVWQDLMFAGGMYPGDDAFMDNVKEEVKYQVERLRHHPCIVLWCGNNEVDEAWNNWGWQDQFNLHGNDSAKVWNDYKRLFEDSLKKWVHDYDGTRSYVASSPMHGWGHDESFKEGDSHYWGLWWGLEDWEAFENKTGRFVSEYGMQAMPNMNTIKTYTGTADRFLYSSAIQSHQKASEGFKKLNYYLSRYFIDSAKIAKLDLEDYTYLTQCLQYYILKNSIAVHRSKYPANMGTLLWQMNDCWPVTSWSITDYSRQPKAAWYAVKEAYRDDVKPAKDTIYPKGLKLEKPQFLFESVGVGSYALTTNTFAKYVHVYTDQGELKLNMDYFDLHPNTKLLLTINGKNISSADLEKLKIKSLYDVIKVQ